MLAAFLLKVLFNDEGVLWGVIKVGVLHIIRVDHNGLTPGLRIDGVAGNCGLLRDDHRAHDSLDGDGPVRLSVVDSVAGDLPVFIIHDTAGGVGHFELDSGQGRLAVQAAVLAD